MKRLLTLMAICLVLVASAGANPIDVLLVGAPGGGAAWAADVQAKLQAFGTFNSVDLFDAQVGTPTVAEMMNYHAVLVYSDFPFPDQTTLGNNLADYVDAGRGVVVATFSHLAGGNAIGGRFDSDDYWCLRPGLFNAGTQLTLGTVNEPLSPLMTDVAALDGGTSSYHITGTLNPAAVVVAEWSNGVPLVMRRSIGQAQRADLNFYPVSSDQRIDFWQSNTDGAELIRNALNYVGKLGPVSVEDSSWGSVKSLYR